MSGKCINFEDKKISKSNFYKNKKTFKIDGININKILKKPLKKNHMAKKIHLNTSLDIMMVIMSLGHEAFSNDWLC